MSIKDLKTMKARYIREGYKLAIKRKKLLKENWLSNALEKDKWIPASEFRYTPSGLDYRKLTNVCEGKNGAPIKVGNYIKFMTEDGEPSKKLKVIAIYECDLQKCNWLSRGATHEIVGIMTVTANKTRYVKAVTVENAEAWRVSSTGKEFET